MKPKIILEDEVHRKVMHWVHKSQLEVSGLGIIRVESDNVIRVIKTMLLPQKNASTHTDIEPEDVARLMYEMREEEGDLRWWWHSHVNMATFWSGTDMDTIKKIGAGGWFTASVFNKRNEVRSAYYGNNATTVTTRTPWGEVQNSSPLFMDELETVVNRPVDTRTAQWDDEYNKNVTEHMTRSIVPIHGGYVGRGPWVRNEHGVFVPGETTTSGGTAAATDPGFDMNREPPLTRPLGMSKRVYKAWKKYHSTMEKISLERGHQVVNEPNSIPGDNIDDNGVDDYGFNHAERALFAQKGWDIRDIDHLVEVENFSPSDLINCAEADITPNEITDWLSQGFQVDDVLNWADQKYLSTTTGEVHA